MGISMRITRPIPLSPSKRPTKSSDYVSAIQIPLTAVVDLGCIFIGHGLAKDFRTISRSSLDRADADIFVPPEQILDTVKIYTTPSRQRRLSLRFLAWFLLHTEIQTASHDSIEDAKYALMLYRAYLEYEREGRFEEIMEQIFEEGQRVVRTLTRPS